MGLELGGRGHPSWRRSIIPRSFPYVQAERPQPIPVGLRSVANLLPSHRVPRPSPRSTATTPCTNELQQFRSCAAWNEGSPLYGVGAGHRTAVAGAVVACRWGSDLKLPSQPLTTPLSVVVVVVACGASGLVSNLRGPVIARMAGLGSPRTHACVTAAGRDGLGFEAINKTG